MNIEFLRPYQPDLARWRPFFLVVGVLLVGLVLLVLAAAIAAGIAGNQPSDLLLAPWRWNADNAIA